MNKLFLYALIGLGATGAVAGGAYLADAQLSARSDVEVKAEVSQEASIDELSRDLIDAKITLQGWYQESDKGTMASAEYQAEFAEDLEVLEQKLQAHAKTMATLEKK